jgi:hypothetical protein
MERVTVVGYRKVSFKTKDGEDVNGTSVYYTFPSEATGMVGEAADKMFINSKVSFPAALKPGDEVEISYNRYGKPNEIRIAKN